MQRPQNLERKIETDRAGSEAITTWYYVIGPQGAVQFMMVRLKGQSYPLDLGYHSYVPMFDGHESMGPCNVLDRDECYYDGSGVNARYVLDEFYVEQDPEAIWVYLEDYYKRVFGEV